MMWLVALAIGGILIAFTLAYRLGVSKSDHKHAIRHIEDLENEAQEWADMPITDDDFNKRMRERIEDKD